MDSAAPAHAVFVTSAAPPHVGSLISLNLNQKSAGIAVVSRHFRREFHCDIKFFCITFDQHGTSGCELGWKIMGVKGPDIVVRYVFCYCQVSWGTALERAAPARLKNAVSRDHPPM